MSRHTFAAAVIDEAAARAALLVASVSKSRFEHPELTAGSLAAVLDGDRRQLSRDPDAPALAITVAVLAPVDESAADLAAEVAEREADAEEAFWSIRDSWEDRLMNPVAGPSVPWLSARRASNVVVGLTRPDMRTLCAVASAQFHFRVKHIQPQ